MLELERSTHSEYSEGPVDDAETLVRLIFDPDHRDPETKTLRPEAINREDLLHRGFSIYRKARANASPPQLDRIKRNIEKYLSRRADRALAGVSEIECGEVRLVVDLGGAQAFVVLDDAREPDDVAHAAIRFANAYPRSQQKRLRDILLHRLGAIRALRGVLLLPGP